MKRMFVSFFGKKLVTGILILVPLIFSGLAYFLAPPLLKTNDQLFLENVMIRYGGLYVLMGSKPAIDFPIDSFFPETSKQNPLELWDNWNTHNHDWISSNYRFVAVKLNNERLGFFINIPSVVWTLKTHYQEFANISQTNFIPEQIIKEFGNEDSLFWSRIFQSSYANGLLLGYGKRNAFLFDYQNPNEKQILLPRFADIEGACIAHSKETVNVSDLPLPSFCTFCLGDEVMETYKRQRQQILQEFDGKDFETTARHWLSGSRKSLEAVQDIR
jgi:hypothetical protein